MKPTTLAIMILCLLIAVIPGAAEPPKTYEIHTDLEFAKPGGVSLKLDAHIPPGKGPFPTVILVHGGGWTGGHKTIEFIQPLFEPLTEDEAVPYQHSTFFQAYMKRLGVRCDLITVEDGLHGVIRWEKDVRFQGYKREMVDWLRANMRPGR